MLARSPHRKSPPPDPMSTRLLPLAISALLVSLLPGCISSHSTTYTDVDRVKISFPTESAGKLFYEAMSHLPSRPTRENKSSVNLIVVDLENTTVEGPNRSFNDAVAICDTDKDGVISEQEAAIFVAAYPAKKRS